MKKLTRALALLICAALLLACLCSCERAEASETGDKSFLAEVDFGKRKIDVNGLKLGMTLEEVLEKEGLTEEDLKLYASKDGRSLYELIEPLHFHESGDYNVLKSYMFNDGLSSVTYEFNYEGVPFEEAYANAVAIYELIDAASPKFDGFEATSGDWDGVAAATPGTSFMEQWGYDNANTHIHLYYQDRISSGNFDTDLLALSFGVSYK